MRKLKYNSNDSNKTQKNSNETQMKGEKMGDDLISRQEAIATAISGRVRALPTTEDGEDWIRVSEVRESLQTVPSAEPEQRWIPCSERLPIKEFEDGQKSRTVYDLYPCLVTRYSTHTDEPRTRTYVCKSYFDGEDFMLHGGYAPNEESDTENTLAWMPLPDPWKGEV